jgi:hypothetical protein
MRVEHCLFVFRARIICPFGHGIDQFPNSPHIGRVRAIRGHGSAQV